VEVEKTIAKLGREPGGGLIVAPDAFTVVHQYLFIRLAQQHRLPAVYFLRTSVAQGALMSYGPDPVELFRRSSSYVDRILKGVKPADLPVQQPTKFELAINLKTAKACVLQSTAALSGWPRGVRDGALLGAGVACAWARGATDAGAICEGVH